MARRETLPVAAIGPTLAHYGFQGKRRYSIDGKCVQSAKAVRFAVIAVAQKRQAKPQCQKPDIAFVGSELRGFMVKQSGLGVGGGGTKERGGTKGGAKKERLHKNSVAHKKAYNRYTKTMTTFSTASPADTAAALVPIDPALVPTRTLFTGAQMPALGLGTFGSDKYTGPQIAGAVQNAARLGYRHFDCASVYGNEADIGDAFRAVMESGVSREALWITSKVWNDKHDAVAESCEQSLRDLGLDYLDLFLVHWPFPNSHGKGVDVSSRDPNAAPYVRENFLQTWAKMENLTDRGLVKHIGTSNMTVSKLAALLPDMRIKPAANEMEHHPHFQQPDLFDFVVKNKIVPIGYSPLGSPSRPERDRTPNDTVDMEDPVLLEIAQKHNATPAQICIRWAITRGAVPIPFSVKPAQYAQSLWAATLPPLSDADMIALGQIDRNNRLIKGQVFLWDGASGWEDLWK